jgi:hypothetical protein
MPNDCLGCRWGSPKGRRHEPFCPDGAKYYFDVMGRWPTGMEPKEEKDDNARPSVGH